MGMRSITPARYHRYIPQRYRLEAAYCKECDVYFFPPRLVKNCHHKKDGKCKCDDFEIRQLPFEGELLTYTIIHTPSDQFSDQKPFALGIVELAPGARITTQIADVDFNELEIGMKVRVEFRRIQTVGDEGVLAYGYKVVKA